MIAVENTGRGIAEQCVAKLRVLKNNRADLEKPNTGPKILQWGIENNMRKY
jgi:hypothetical protein